MSLTGEAILEKIREGERSSIIVNEIFLEADFDYLDSNIEITALDGSVIGELDGIWSHNESKTVILIEATSQKSNIAQKIAHFFLKWTDNSNLDIVLNKYRKQRYNVMRVFADLNGSYKKMSSSYKHLTKNEADIILFREDVKYFDVQRKIIGRHVKNDILYSLDIPRTNIDSKIPALKRYIGNQLLYVFSINAKDLLEICYVNRRRKRFGYQRLLSQSRIKNIRKVIQESDSLTFPNSILVASDNEINEHSEIYNGVNLIYLPKSYCSLRVIDGQHRLMGFTKLSDSFLEKHDLIVVLLAKIDFKKEIYTFIEINSRSKPVDSNLILNLKSDLDYPIDHDFYDQKIAVQVCKKLNENSVLKGSIFFGEVDEYLSNVKQKIKLTTLVKALIKNRIIGDDSVFHLPRSDINKIYNEIKTLFSSFVKDDHKSARIMIFNNLGIRIFFRLLTLHQKSVDFNGLKKSRNDFITDLRDILTSDFLEKELFFLYGEGGANKATEMVVMKLAKYDKKYERFRTDLRGLV